MTFQQQLDGIRKYQAALSDKLAMVEYRLNNPAMDRQQYPQGMTDIKAPEVVKEWEILEFREAHNGCAFVVDHFGNYNSAKSLLAGYPLEAMLTQGCCVASGHWIIYSVRRLSDNTVWAVGGMFTIGDNAKVETIQAFKVYDDIMRVHGDLVSTPLANLVKAPPLYTTADGVEVPQYTTVYYYEVPHGAIHVGSVCAVLSGPYYSTRYHAKAAYEKWLSEQRVLCLNDLDLSGLKGVFRDHVINLIKERVKP